MEHMDDTELSNAADPVFSHAVHNALQSIPTYLTFDDVLLLPQASDILPSAASTRTQFTRAISLNIPFVSAAMDTVTESAMAIAMAKSGGIGVLHRSLEPQRQADEVRKVKRASTLVIRQPIVVQLHETIAEARTLMRAHNVHGLPVVDEHDTLVGILTSRDMRAANDLDESVESVMTTALITAAEPISSDDARTLMVTNKIEKLPLVNEGRLTGLMTLRDITQTDKHPLANTDDGGHLRVAAAVGTDATTEERVSELVSAGIDVVVIDTAHGHSARVIETARRVRKDYPDIQLIVGNIATAQAARDLLDVGVDAIKVGIGPGSICTTRVVAGVGAPQLSAIMDVFSVTRGSDVPIIADGGIRHSGDAVKALAAGASSVMLGTMLAGCKESPGEQIMRDGHLYKSFRGMGSLGAMKRGSRDRYFQDHMEADEDLESKLVPEGVEGIVPFKGDVKSVLYQLAGGLRSGMG
ncbi:MAG TPA: IMP dehydrogenase, partial [Acidimicrobiia bacterium]|nr:IMP dehydrogenase [Acidimicrobiia bacterium]